MSKKIALCMAYYTFNSVPIISLIKFLKKNGYDIHLYSYKNYEYEYSSLKNYDIKVVSSEKSNVQNNSDSFYETLKKINNKYSILTILTKLIKYIIENIKKASLYLKNYKIMCLYYVYKYFGVQISIENIVFPKNVVQLFKNEYARNEYVYVIGVDTQGLILATLLDKNRKVVNYSLELFKGIIPDAGAQGFMFALMNEQSTKYLKNVIFTIIQDFNRSKVFLKLNNISNHEFQYIPVGPQGLAYRNKSRYLYEMLGIDISKKIILQCGGIYKRRKSDEIIRVAPRLKDSYVLLLHGNIQEDIKKQVHSYNVNNNILLSSKLIDMDIFEDAISSAFVGLIFYSDETENEYNIGYSSGQLSQYMRCGIPVVAINYPTLRETIGNYDCGVLVDAAEQIPEALKIVEKRYDELRENAFRCYEEIYNTEKKLVELLHKLENY